MSEPLPSLDDLSPSEAVRVERACSRFERAWKDWRGRPRPALEDGLGEADGPARAVLLGELLRLEVTERTVERRLGVIRKLWSAGEGAA